MSLVHAEGPVRSCSEPDDPFTTIVQDIVPPFIEAENTFFRSAVVQSFSQARELSDIHIPPPPYH